MLQFGQFFNVPDNAANLIHGFSTEKDQNIAYFRHCLDKIQEKKRKHNLNLKQKHVKKKIKTF